MTVVGKAEDLEMTALPTLHSISCMLVNLVISVELLLDPELLLERQVSVLAPF